MKLGMTSLLLTSCAQDTTIKVRLAADLSTGEYATYVNYQNGDADCDERGHYFKCEGATCLAHRFATDDFFNRLESGVWSMTIDAKDFYLFSGLPPYWRNETSGNLREAIETYIRYKAKEIQNPPTTTHIKLIKSYLAMWIYSPAYIQSPGFEAEKKILRDTVEHINSVQDIDRWLDAAMEIGIDPL